MAGNASKRGPARRFVPRRLLAVEQLEQRALLSGDYGLGFSIGGLGEDHAFAVAGDPQGNVYIAGQVEGPVDFDPGAGQHYLRDAGGADAFVAKYSATGSLIWARRIGGADDDQVRAMALGADGSVYIAGLFQGTASMGPNQESDLLYSAGADDVFVCRLSPLGDLIWARQLGGVGRELVESVALGDDGSVYTAGAFEGTVDFDPGDGQYPLRSRGGHDAFLSRLDPDGEFAWAASAGGTGTDLAGGVAAGADGVVVFAGSFENTAEIRDFNGAIGLTGAGNTDGFLARLSPGGSLVWARSLGGPLHDRVSAVAVEGGCICAVGSFQGTADLDPGPATALFTSAGDEDAFVSKFGASGKLVWARQMGGRDTAVATAVAVDSEHNVYTTGVFHGTALFDPGGARIMLRAENADGFIAKHDPAGRLSWAHDAGGPGDDAMEAIAVGPGDSLCIAGAFQDAMDLDPGAEATPVESAGMSDVFLLKLVRPPIGDLVWNDLNGDGVQDPREPGIKDATVELFRNSADAGGTVYVATTTTNALGRYRFENNLLFRPGSYFLRFTLLDGYIFTVSNAGDDDTNDSDADTRAGVTDEFTLEFGQSAYDQDAGMGGHFPDVGFLLSIDSDGLDEGRAAAADRAGNVVVVGRFTNEIDFDPGRPKWDFASVGGEDVFVAKYGSAGNLLWARTFGGVEDDVAFGVAVDDNLNVYVTGSFRDTVDFDPGHRVFELTSAGESDVFVARLDRYGDFLWARRFGGVGPDTALGLALDQAGNIYTAGSFYGIADFDPGKRVFELASAGEADAFIAKLDCSGNFGWARSFGGGEFDEATGIAVGDDGHVRVTGHFRGTADFNPVSAVAAQRSSVGLSDVFLSAFTDTGELIWVETLGGIADDLPDGVAVDQDGNSYVAGAFQGVLDFDAVNPEATLISDGDYDIFVSKYDAAGGLLWTRRVGGQGIDRANSVALDHRGHVLLTGLFEGMVDFDPSDGQYLVNSHGRGDLFSLKLEQDGDFRSARSFGGPSGNEEGFGIVVNRAGVVYITGVFYSDEVFPGSLGGAPGGVPIEEDGETAKGGGSVGVISEPDPNSISNYVWNDIDLDGIQDANTEWGLSNVQVELYQPGPDGQAGTPDDVLVDDMLTDAFGLYLFGALSPGDYYLRFDDIDGFQFTLKDQGADEELDSDADPSDQGRTGLFSLVYGEAIDWQDAGQYSSGENHAPVAIDDLQSVEEDHLVTGNVLDNDSDPDGDTLSALLDEDVSHGILTFNETSGSYSYTPDEDFFGTDSFTYWADDTHELSNLATVTITVDGVNDPPELTNPIPDVTVDENDPPEEVDLGNSFDDPDLTVKGDWLTYSVTANGNPGLVETAVFGSTLRLTFVADRNGVAQITVRATDSESLWVEDSFTVTVVSAEPVPQASIDHVLRPEGHSGTTDFDFTVSLSEAATEEVAVRYDTIDGTAVAGSDYQAAGGTLTFAPGEQFKTITVGVFGDTVASADKTFSVVLSNPTGATIDAGTGQGTIFDDDDGPFQTVLGDPAELTVKGGEGFDVVAGYTTSDDDSTLPGLDLRLHFNSTVLSFDGFSGVLGTGYVGQQGPTCDVLDLDGDPNTDQYVAISWTDAGGNWPGGVLPVELCHAGFTPVPGLPHGKPTTIRFSGSSTAPAHDFLSTPVDVVVELPAEVVGRYVFYNGSSFDGNDSAANDDDDAAVATDKQALLPGGTATFANYTSYSRGINGLMIDVARLAATPTAADFALKVGNDNSPDGWSEGPAPTSVSVRPGMGVGGSDRMTILFADGDVLKQWLQVTALAGGNLGLVEDDVFYFGNAVADAGNSTNDARVNATDMLLARNNPRTFLNPAGVDFDYDFNRDARVNATDMLLARNNQTHFLNALQLITAPSKSAGPKDSQPKVAVEKAAGGQTSPVPSEWVYEFARLGSGDRLKKDRMPQQVVDALLACCWW
ncbi:MAG: cadherin-like domain-containing protein [Pirellulales bacterium]|nr:cadherin-like domain-containing protein [Pirellulales bacterium]